MRSIAAFLCGLVSGLGLLVSDMTDPRRVLGFLDLAGHWNPSLGVVALAALAVAAPAFAIARRRPQAVLGGPTLLSRPALVDRRFLIGACVLGIGWGLAGLTPGAAIVLLPTLRKAAWIFVVAMLGGMAACEAWQRATRRQ